MSEEYREFNVSDYVKTEEDVQGLLRAAWDEDIGDGAVIRAVLTRIARTQSMSALAHDIGLNGSEELSKDGNPSLVTLLKVTRALGLCLAPVENST
ncbi:MAG: putative addiction module antidote protein [Dehalococcoidia bacterium]|nr:putative addiction module antidote protein [Dehalococcoidia bacterium]